MQPGKPLPDIRSLMAVINSVGVGRGSKSVGEFTYRYTRGRTIASRRITKNTSKTPAQVGRRGAFGSFVWMFSPYKWFFSDGYEKTKHGSSFNQFVHVNRELLGKSPYNSEVNKKLIPNGKQLWTLTQTIFALDTLHLKYASYGTLPSVDTSSVGQSFFAYGKVVVNVYVEDFKGLTVTFNSITSDGDSFSKTLDLYVDSKIPSVSISYDWIPNESIAVTSLESDGMVSFVFQPAATLAYILGLDSKPAKSYHAYTSIVIKQYGKIASLNRVQRNDINVTSSGDENLNSSEPTQEDYTEIK